MNSIGPVAAANPFDGGRSKYLAVVVAAILLFVPAAVFAQSPNTASLTVVVVYPNGAVVKGAKVSVTNSATAAVRDGVSDNDGGATFSALPLTGTYTVAVSQQGFGDQSLKDIALRAGESSTVKVTLSVGTGKAEVTVFGTADGVRSDPQIGRSIATQQ